MTLGRDLRVCSGWLLAAATLVAAAGCDVFNPSLGAALGISPVRSLDGAEGPVVILVMNRTAEIVSARVVINKINGGQVELNIPVQPFGDGTGRDHAAAVQDCDLVDVQLLLITATSAGGIVEVPSATSAVRMGYELSCGKVIAITIQGTAPALTAEILVIG